MKAGTLLTNLNCDIKIMSGIRKQMGEVDPHQLMDGKEILFGCSASWKEYFIKDMKKMLVEQKFDYMNENVVNWQIINSFRR